MAMETITRESRQADKHAEEDTHRKSVAMSTRGAFLPWGPLLSLDMVLARDSVSASWWKSEDGAGEGEHRCTRGTFKVGSGERMEQIQAGHSLAGNHFSISVEDAGT